MLKLTTEFRGSDMAQSDANGAGLQRAYLPGLDAFRIIAFGLVTVHHYISVEAKYAGDTLLSPQLTYGISGVDLFFVLSGYMMTRLYLNRSDERRPGPLQFIIDRFARVYPVYWAVTAALVAVYLYNSDLVFGGSRYVEPSLVRSFLLWPDVGPPLNAVAWSLVHLVYFYVVSAVILKLPHGWLKPAMAIWVVATLGLYGIGASAWSYEFAVFASPLTLEYVAGMVVALIAAPSKRIAIPVVAASTVAIIAAVTFMNLNDIQVRHIEPLYRVAFYAPVPALLIWGLGGWTAAAPQPGLFSLAGFARAGFSLFLTHILVLSVLGLIWARFTQPGLWDNILALPIMLAAAMAGAMICERVFETPIARFVRTQTRKRKEPRLQQGS